MGRSASVGALAHLADHRLAAAARDLHVEQQEIEPRGVERAPRLVDGGRLDDLVAAQLEEVVQQQPVERVVLDDQDPGAPRSLRCGPLRLIVRRHVVARAAAG